MSWARRVSAPGRGLDISTSLIVKLFNGFRRFSSVNPHALHSRIVTRSRRVFDASTMKLKEVEVCTKAKNTVLMKAMTPAQKKESALRSSHTQRGLQGKELRKEQKSAPLGQVWGMKSGPFACQICSFWPAMVALGATWVQGLWA